MKRCPECRRDYHDDSLLYCLEDGVSLVQGTVPMPDEPLTAILHQTAPSAESATRAQIHTTEQTAVMPSSGIDIPKAKRFDRRLLLAPVAIAAVILAFFAGYQYLRPAASNSITSIAVLPFENRGSDADTDYLSDGLAESLIFRLTQLPGLKVSPTSSVMRYKGKETDVAKIASELGVDAVLTGRLMKRGESLNITVELVDARNNKSLWGEQYERRMSDLLTTQREIAATIVDKLQLRLSGDDAKGITKRYTDNNDAYQLYMRGRYSFAKRTKDEMLRAIGYFEQAVKLDPGFALAYARISEVYGSMPAYPYMSPKEAFPQAKAAAQKALEIDPTLAEAHTFLAYSLIIHEWNWTEGERSFKRAIELDPNNAAAHFRFGQVYLTAVGRLDEALVEVKRGYDLEPLDINMGTSLAWFYLVAGQKDRSLEQARRMYDLEPGHPLTRWILCQTYSDLDMYRQAIAIAEPWLNEDPTNQFALREAGIAYAKVGMRDKAEEMISRLREIARTEYVAMARLAAIYVALGEKDKAFAELEKALEVPDWELYRFNVDIYWKPLHGDPRFAALVKRLDLPN